jgi:hypothetical protein
MYQTTLSTDIMILVNICHLLPTTHHTPYAPCCQRPAVQQFLPAIHHQFHTSQDSVSALQQVFGSYMQDYESSRMSKWDWKPLLSWQHSWECRAKYRVSIPWSAVRNVLEGMLGSLRKSASELNLGVSSEHTREYTPAGWQCVIKCNWECTTRTYAGVFLGVLWDLSWVCTVRQARTVVSTWIGSILESTLRSLLGNVLISYLQAYSPAGCGCCARHIWEHS